MQHGSDDSDNTMSLQSDDGGHDEAGSESSDDDSAHGIAHGRGRSARRRDVQIADLVAESGWQKMDKVDPPTHPLVRVFDSIFVNKCDKM